MTHAERIVAHVKSLLGNDENSELINNYIMNDVPYEEFDEVFDALTEAGFGYVWQFQILHVTRP